METRISKAQLEVWNWKENLYKELKNVPKNEILAYIKNKVKDTINQIRKKKDYVKQNGI